MTPPVRWLLMAGHVPASGLLGGIVRYTVELAHALERRDDVELHLLASPAAAETLAGIVGGQERVVRLPAVPGGTVPALERWALAQRLGDRFDVVHGTKHLLPRGVAAHTVLTVHDMLLLDRPEDFAAPKRALLRGPYRASLRQARTLVCVSAATRDRLAAWEPRAAARAAVVPLATSTRLREATPVPVGALDGRPFGLVVGDGSPRKNVPVVTAAWARVVRQHPDAVLVHVGPPEWGAAAYGPDHPALLASGNLLQLTGVDDGTLRWCYEHAAVVLAPSLAEGFGLPAAEALDLGAPLVTSHDPALCEVSGDRAEHLAADDVQGWADAVLRHLAPRGQSAAPARATPLRTWDDVAADTVRAVRGDGLGT
ncbi:Glycosyltransferase involved in cell wall bisynthesis [Geodermatophilus pulveris]|uniref:Glycosyltransferase involved in cell wall bisynthesis n=1 Tax=Geodermatophilus pulveris TaxID=1564159 RepID=A0A239J781_9ACTN|nr:glycosyltransferase family 1 protein [Geodermatophilus pulveris]SNT01751.1 Glycosyltransferase involved in cell wall bisynthesis [Geodermatophilus pulveris]